MTDIGMYAGVTNVNLHVHHNEDYTPHQRVVFVTASKADALRRGFICVSLGHELKEVGGFGKQTRAEFNIFIDRKDQGYALLNTLHYLVAGLEETLRENHPDMMPAPLKKED